MTTTKAEAVSDAETVRAFSDAREATPPSYQGRPHASIFVEGFVAGRAGAEYVPVTYRGTSAEKIWIEGHRAGAKK